MNPIHPPYRISVVDTSGSGKSTLALTLATHLGLPYTELDQLHWLPNWTPRELPDFRAQVEAIAAGDHPLTQCAA